MKISLSALILLTAGEVYAEIRNITKTVSTRIVNGEDAPVGRFPYYASLYRNGRVQKSNFVCGASLIAPDMLLTAAHCEQPDFQVVVGNSKITGEGTVRDVVRKFPHEDYRRRSIRNDIMLLKLDSPVDDIKPVTLNFDETLPYQEELVTLGLGQLAESDRDLPENLQFVKLPEYPFEECEAVYVPQLGGFFQEIFENFFLNMEESQQICAGGVEGKGSCYGDSGGPLVLSPDGVNDGDYYGDDDVQLGLTSFGRICGSENPGVYTRVSGYEFWIKDRVCEYSDSPPDYCDGYESPEGGDGNGGDGGSGGNGGDSGGIGGAFCFSGEDTVEVEHIGSVTMKNLKIGDSIQVGLNKYEEVYSFGHHSDSIKTEFLRIKTSNGEQLEVTKDHLVFIEGGLSIPASDLKQGTQLIHNDGLATVKAIDKIIRNGMYAPFTPSGKLLVNGFQVSSFVAINGAATVQVMGIDFHYHTISKLFESPRRLVCKYVYGNCEGELYDELSGISTWHGIALEAYQGLLNKNNVIFSIGFLATLVTVGFMSAFECIIDYLFIHSSKLTLFGSIILAIKHISGNTVRKGT